MAKKEKKKENAHEEFDKKRKIYMERTKARLATELLQAEHKIDELNKHIDRWRKRDEDKEKRAYEITQRLHDSRQEADRERIRANRAEGERHLLIESIAGIVGKRSLPRFFGGY